MRDIDEDMFRKPSVQYMTSVLPRRNGEGYLEWSTRFQILLDRVSYRQKQAQSASLAVAAVLVALRWEQMTWKSATASLVLAFVLAWVSSRVVGAFMYVAASMGDK